MKNEQFWQYQIENNRRQFKIFCITIALIECVMILIYALSQKMGDLALIDKYLQFYLSGIFVSLTAACLLLVAPLRPQLLNALHRIYLVFIYVWACLFATFDISQGSSGYVLVHIIVFAAAVLRLPTLLHCSLNVAAYLLFAILAIQLKLDTNTILSELINSLVAVTLACIIIVFTNRLHIQSYYLHETVVSQNKQLSYYAQRDSLTGLFNRRVICDYLEQVMTEQRRGLCIMLDIDDFKDYNDSFGHIEGDTVLKTLSEHLAAFAAEHGGRAGRYGGEEFILVIPRKTVREILPAIEGFLQEVQAESFLRQVTVSIGVHKIEPGIQLKNLLAGADEALYRAKGNGKNRFEIFSEMDSVC